MIHQLALATNPQLLEKLSAITVEDHLAGKARDVQKAIDLANARGIDVPLVEKRVGWDAAKQKYITEMVPDVENLRMTGGQPRGAAQVAPALIEKEIQQKHTGLTPAKKLRHKTVGGLKRFWGGQGGLGGKWRNRAALLGGLGAVGLGIKSYLDYNRLSNPAMAQQQLQVPPEYYKMGASSRYVQDAANIPAPPSQPKVKAPGPSVSSVGSLGSGKPSGLPGAPNASGGTLGSGKESLAAYAREKQADDAMLPVLAGGIGGIGGWALGDKVIKPMLEKKERSLAEAISAHQKNMARIKGAKQMVPLGAAAAGALLLAALAAIKARQSEAAGPYGTPPSGPIYAPASAIGAYDPSGAGFVPNNVTYPGFY